MTSSQPYVRSRSRLHDDDCASGNERLPKGDCKKTVGVSRMTSPTTAVKRHYWFGVVHAVVVTMGLMGVMVYHHRDNLVGITTSTQENIPSYPMNTQHRHHRRLEEATNLPKTVFVFAAVTDPTSLASRKFVLDLHQQTLAPLSSSSSSTTTSTMPQLEIHVAESLEDQKKWIQDSACSVSNDDDPKAVLTRFQELVDAKQPQFATEIYKYCALRLQGGIWLDSESPWIIPLVDFLQHEASFIADGQAPTFSSLPSMAVLGDASNVAQTIHGSFLLLQPEQKQLAHDMLQVLVSSPIQDLLYDALLVPHALHDAIERQVKDTLRLGANHQKWYLLEQQCYLSQTFRWQGNTCPLVYGGFCCRVLDKSQTLFLTRHPLLPIQKTVDIAKPYNAETQHYDEKDLPYIAKIREEVFPKPPGYEVKNMFDILMENQCLPDSVDCARCLRNKSGANCKTCATQCQCYCKALCNEKPDAKHVSKKISVFPPKFARDPNRLVPRIIHQTYYEELTADKYPNMSRMVESFKQSGWEYRFYSDEDAQNFLSTHFPPEVREAYDTLRPGAFKADLFRYCALLIHGGVYADVDIILESNLDASVPPDAGFVVPVDEPGIEAKLRMCVWNGFIATAPAHPFLAQVIETVVNQVRNRYTSVDVDATFCPDPELSVLHAFDTLFTAGPCALGAAINRVMGRNGQSSFTAGEMVFNDGTKTGNKDVSSSTSSTVVPGRTIILHQNKWDMGGHRFTLLEQNLVVAATDLPDSDDRESEANTLSGNTKKKEHYSKTHASVGIYGLEHLYNDDLADNKAAKSSKPNNHKAMENVQFQVVPASAMSSPPAQTAVSS
ncbi:hypothetical protein ACA910_019021 [Epithemia clementina (nom. ined.)]